MSLRFLTLAAYLWALVTVVVIGSMPTPVAAHAARSTHPALVICSVFGRQRCLEALEVSWCESRFSIDARNGEYRGLFQMGSWERRTYGHGAGPLAQARAARRYFVASGRDWSPWSCKP